MGAIIVCILLVGYPFGIIALIKLLYPVEPCECGSTEVDEKYVSHEYSERCGGCFVHHVEVRCKNPQCGKLRWERDDCVPISILCPPIT